MNCAYHPQNFAAAGCHHCGRALCPACDHRIKGFPFCQDCIVSGINLLQQHNAAAPVSPTQKNSPLIAAALSLICPGLGAAYNGQNSKALAHFGIFVGLFQMGVSTNGIPLFVLGFLGVWLFAAVDAFRTARAFKLGFVPLGDDSHSLKLSGNPLFWAISLIALGTLFFLYTFLNVRLPIGEILPILLVGLGVYWLINFVQQKRRPQPVIADNFAAGLPPGENIGYHSINSTRISSERFGE